VLVYHRVCASFCMKCYLYRTFMCFSVIVRVGVALYKVLFV